MNLSLKSTQLEDAHIVIPGSKSESNRLLILSSLFKKLSLENISNSDDTNYLLNALSSKSSTIDIGNGRFSVNKGNGISLSLIHI